MQDQKPHNAPPGTIQVNLDEGFGPHLADEFLERYGEDSVFVTATVDCLTWRFLQVLINAEKVAADTTAMQYGPVEMRQALEGLLTALAARGLEKPSIDLMRSAVGHESAGTFEETACSLLGEAVFSNWRASLEQEDYASAGAVLVVLG